MKKIFYVDRFTNYSTKIFEDLQEIVSNEKNYQVFFIGPQTKDDRTWLSDNYVTNAKRIWNFAHYVRKLYAYTKIEKPNIIHFSFEWRMFGPIIATIKFPFLLLLLRIGTKTKIIVNLHALLISKHEFKWKIIDDVIPQKIPRLIFTVFMKIFIKSVCKSSHKIIVDAPRSKLGLIEFYGIKKEKIVVNELIIPPDKFIINSEKKAKFDKQFSGKKIILCFGVISPRKSLDIIIKAFNAISEKLLDHVLVIVGLTTDDYKTYEHMLHELVAQFNIKNKVIFTGFVDDEDAEILFEMAEMALYIYYPVPDISGAVFPAIYHNTPCIVTEGEYFSYLFSKKDVLFVEYKNENQLSSLILKLANDDSLKEELQHRMKILAKKISKSTTASQYFETYKNIFNK